MLRDSLAPPAFPRKIKKNKKNESVPVQHWIAPVMQQARGGGEPVRKRRDGDRQTERGGRASERARERE